MPENRKSVGVGDGTNTRRCLDVRKTGARRRAPFCTSRYAQRCTRSALAIGQMMCPVPVTTLDSSRVYSDHQRLEARSLATHSLVAKRLRANPALVDRARRTLERWRAQAGEPPPSYFIEWGQILASSLEEIVSFVVSTHEDAKRLRQSSPFTGFLTPKERTEIYKAFSRTRLVTGNRYDNN